MSIIEHRRDGYLISTDRTRLDIATIHTYLSQVSYWAQGRPLEVQQTAINQSLCFGVYHIAAQSTQQVGFARVVTDYATFAWLCDVFILEAQQGLGLGKWLVESVMAHPTLQKVGLVLLATRDAHQLYQTYGGFEPVAEAERWMLRPK
jgi:GNAT superfamily N-acetyltransferase